MDTILDNFYVKFVACKSRQFLPDYTNLLTLFLCIVSCLIGCLTLHSITPWNHVTKAIEELNNNEGKRLQFITDLESLHQKYKYGSKEFSLSLADLVVVNATKCYCFLFTYEF